MNNFYLLVAHEHRLSCHVLATVIKLLRPAIKVINVEPNELDTTLRRLKPHLVVCSQVTECLKASDSDWLLLYPGGAPWVEQRIAGKHGTADQVDFSLLLTYIDHCANMWSQRECEGLKRPAGSGCLR